jgi:hypothetical protein
VKRLAIIALSLLAGCGPNAGSTPAAAIDFKCDLPVEAIVQGEIQGGFVHFPGGGFHHDLRADSVLTSVLPPSVPGGPPPHLQRDVASYDAVVRRWLPVPWSWVSADGLRYAYSDGIFPSAPANPEPGPGPFAIGSRVHVVEVKSGDDRVIFSSNGGPFYTIVKLAQDGIYMTAGMPGPDGWKLWRLDSGEVTITKLSDRRGAPWVIRDRVPTTSCDSI